MPRRFAFYHRSDRRGATLVLVAIMMVMLVGIGGIAIDYSRMYVYQSQLQNAADAGAHSGAVDVMNSHIATAQATAVTTANLNPVDQTGSVVASDIIPGTWDYATHAFTAAPWDSATAVKATSRYSANYTLGRIFGGTSLNLTKVAIAALGYRSTSSCLKPFGVSYRALLDALPGGSALPITHDLTAAEVNTLSQMRYPQDSLALLVGTPTQVTNGNIAQVFTEPSGSGLNYNKSVQDTGCESAEIAPGDTIAADPGAGSGQTATPLKKFCQDMGGIVGAGAQSFTCTAQPPVELVIYDQVVSLGGGGSGANTGYVVKYIGVFHIDGFHGGGKAGDQVVGTFGTLNSGGGGFSTKPGLIGKAVALVQ
jgi:Flp pilus assembly protein TadG